MTMQFPPQDFSADGLPASGTPDGGFLDAPELAGTLFREIAEDLTAMRLKIRAGQTDDLKEAVKLVRDLRDATKLVLEERGRVDKLRKEIAGDVGAGSLELAAARDEIGRRLACLRRAGAG